MQGDNKSQSSSKKQNIDQKSGDQNKSVELSKSPQHQQKPLDIILPKRIKGGNLQSVNIVSNHFQIKFTEQFEKLYIFSIKFQPMIQRDNRKKRRQVMDAAMSQIKEWIDNPTICGLNLLTNRKPRQQFMEIQAKDHKISFKQVKVVDTKQDMKTFLFFLNNRFRNTMAEAGFQEIGKTGKYFNIRYKREIDNLNMYSGFRANFVSLQKAIYLRVDSAKKIVRNQTVLQHIKELYNKNSNRDRDDKRNIVRNALVNQIIQVNYGNGRYYKIADIIYKDMNEEMFGEEKFNIIDYYKTRYGITIKDVKQPLLKAEKKKEGQKDTLLVPELCLMTGIPDDFDEFKRKKISESTILDARTKRQEILGIVRQLEVNRDFEDLEKVGIKLSKKLYSFDGKMLPTPRITLGQDQRVQEGKEAFFNLFGQPIYASKHRIKCAIFYFRSDLRDMIRTFEQTSKNLKVQFAHEQFKINDQRNAVQQIRRSLRKIKQNGFNICLVVIPPNMKSQYKRIKEVCLIEHQIVSQIAVQSTLRKKNAQSIATKILLQIIAKRGNTLWCPKSKSSFDSVMLVGFDNACLEATNILTTCGTVNSTFTSIYTKKSQYKGNEQKFVAIKNSVLQIVNYSVDRNGAPPKQIILFMNSCSIDQVRNLKQYFIDDFVQKLENVYKEKAPALQVVMVNTKTSQRFFTDNGQNVRAGTLINSDVVSKDYDFFMVSQNSNRGCVVPNHYKVVYSSSKMSDTVLAELIFNQCFNYVNWSGSIKIPGILQYAKKCAKFNSEVLEEKKLPEALEKSLYFV